MNTIQAQQRPDPAEWERPELRAVLAARNITVLFRFLQKLGFSQQKIAAWCGMSQPEVSAIIHGRQVQAYDVLERVVVGLGIPRTYVGLGFKACTCTCTCETPRREAGAPEPDSRPECEQGVLRRAR